MLDNPDAAYAKLREMGTGLFGKDGSGLGSILNSLGLGGNAPGGGAAADNANPQAGQPGQPAQNNPLGGPLGEAIGNLIQQGLSAGGNPAPGAGRSRSIPVTPGTPAPQPSPAPQAQSAPAPDDPSVAQQDSQPMNDVLRQLFNR